MRDGVSLKPGALFGRYRLDALIGAGGFSDVYKATRVSDKRAVAIKCIQSRHATNPRVRDRMGAEAELLARLQHANVVRVIEAGIHDDILFMVMEYLSGRTLRDVMLAAGGRLPILKALYYAREIADGIAAAHEMRVVHRDLKPENVMVSDGDEVKVLDLGAGKFFGWGVQSTGHGPIIGTPAYMSPEHIRGIPVDGRTDIYALGFILYEMLAGRYPFAHQSGEMPSRLEIPMLHLHATPPSLTAIIAGFPPYVAAVVDRAIAKDRNLRWGTMREFAQAIRGAFRRYQNELSERGGAAEGSDAGHPGDTAAAGQATGRGAIDVRTLSARARPGAAGLPESGREIGSGNDSAEAITIELRRGPGQHGDELGSAVEGVAAVAPWDAVAWGGTEPLPQPLSRPPAPTLELKGALPFSAPVSPLLSRPGPVTDRLPPDPTSPREGSVVMDASSSDTPVARSRHPAVLPLAMFLGCLLGSIGVGSVGIYLVAPSKVHQAAPLNVPAPTNAPKRERRGTPAESQAVGRKDPERAAGAPAQEPSAPAGAPTPIATTNAAAATAAKVPVASPSHRASVDAPGMQSGAPRSTSAPLERAVPASTSALPSSKPARPAAVPVSTNPFGDRIVW